jgi:hypothetical protein
MAVDFAILCSLVRPGRPRYPVLVHQAAVLLHASFRPRLTATPLRFANPSPPSGWIEDFHLQATDHARHTKETRLRGGDVGLTPLAALGHPRKPLATLAARSALPSYLPKGRGRQGTLRCATRVAGNRPRPNTAIAVGEWNSWCFGTAVGQCPTPHPVCIGPAAPIGRGTLQV